MSESRTINLIASEDKKLVKMFTDPATGSAITGHRFISSFGADSYVSEGDLMDYHIKTDDEVVKGDLTELERMLTSQAIVLDQIFKGTLNRSVDNITEYPKASATYMNMALKAQSQCRCTVEAINEIKSPKSVTITKQANIADQQIVNNGNMNTNACAEKNANESNELLSEVEHEKMDTRGTTSPKQVNQTVEAVETINRSKDRSRKS